MIGFLGAVGHTVGFTDDDVDNFAVIRHVAFAALP